jgi:hypothetical protein
VYPADISIFNLIDNYMSSLVPFFLALLLILNASAQVSSKVFTSDIDNFWTAYDSIRTTNDSTRQIQFIKELYIDKGSEGLKAFMQARDYTAERWISLIKRYPKFWNSIRPNTLNIQSKAAEIDSSIRKLKALYPSLREAKIYFTIGALRSGGTTTNDMVLIGSEIATGTAATDVAEFPDQWLANVFKTQDTGNIVPLNIHEYIHTQQKGESQDLLGQCIREGACDFITELVMGRPLTNNYIQYGNEHEKELKAQFKQEMFSTFYTNWLYNGSSAKTVADLGYFMGYAICKSYYQQASNKSKAVKEIIELNYSNYRSVEQFLKKARYYPEGFDKDLLRLNFEIKRPRVLRLEPFSNQETSVDPDAKEMKIIFSAPMNKKTYSINFGKRGKDYSPIAGIGGFSEDGTSFTIKLNLQPDHEYEFLITDLSFKSAEGYPLKPMEVKFKTRKN